LNKNSIKKAGEGEGVSRAVLFLGMPVAFFALLACVWWLPQVIVRELYEKLYLPYVNGAPVLLHVRSGIFLLAILPSVVLALPIPVLALLKGGFHVDFSRYQQHINRYGRWWGYIALAGLALSFPANFYVVGKIQAKGYVKCEYLNASGLTRRVTGYVIHPMLCVPEKQRAEALRHYEQIRLHYPDLLEQQEAPGRFGSQRR